VLPARHSCAVKEDFDDGFIADMCGRFSLTANNNELNQRFGIAVLQNLAPRWNIAPSQSTLILRARGLETTAEMAAFGRPSGAAGKRLINARAESVQEKPTFRDVFVHSRCLVLASGWFEWAAPQRPYHVQLLDGRVMAMAGLYFPGHSTEQGHFVIVTTAADGSLKDIHHRCPLVLPSARWTAWLRGPVDAASSCLVPASASFFNSYRVSPDVGNVRNDNAGLVAPFTEPASAQATGQRDLFS